MARLRSGTYQSRGPLNLRQTLLASEVAADIERIESEGRIVTENERAYMRRLVRQFDVPLPGLSPSNIETLHLK